MSRWARSGAAVAITLSALAAGAGLPGLAAGAASPTATDLKGKVRELRFETRDLRFEIVSIDGSVSDVRTTTKVEVTLAADVLFAFDKADLAPVSQATLSELAPQIGTQAKGTVKIDGYTDAKGQAAYNQDLSERRAQAVQKELEGKLAGKTVTFAATGHGATDFIAPNAKPDGSDDPDGRAKNRRVTITYNR
jgi:OOP family OmpA-OmpF porin